MVPIEPLFSSMFDYWMAEMGDNKYTHMFGMKNTILEDTKTIKIATVRWRDRRLADAQGFIILDARPNDETFGLAMPGYLKRRWLELDETPEWIIQEYYNYLWQSIETNKRYWKQFLTCKRVAIACEDSADKITAWRMVLRNVLAGFCLENGIEVEHCGEIYREKETRETKLVV